MKKSTNPWLIDRRRFLEELLSARRVTVLGPAARTWYRDLKYLDALMADLADFGVSVVSGDKLPFDGWLEHAAERYGVDVIHTGALTLEERLQSTGRSVDVLDLANLVVAFPREGDLLSADPVLAVAPEFGFHAVYAISEAGHFSLSRVPVRV